MRSRVSLAVALVTLIACVAGEFSNTMELESVTTFDTCTEAFPEGFNDPFARQACVAEDAPVTAIRYIVRPGEDDSAGGSAMAFFAYPPPFASQPINEDTDGPPDNPCAFSSVTENCTGFSGNNNETGPITLEAKATHIARKYYLRKILGTNHVPYTYTEHKLPVPRVNIDTTTCSNTCDTNGNADGKCEPGDKDNKGWSWLIGCAYIDDFDVHVCEGTHPGSIYTSAQQFSQFSDTCGYRDTYLLLNNGDTDDSKPFGPLNAPPEACRSCPATYTKATRPEAAQTNGNDNAVTIGNCSLIQMQTDDTPKVTPLLHPTLCPTGIGHVGNYPGVTNDLHSHGEGATDGYSLEPYYYWCQSQCVGDGSYTQKDIFELRQTHEDCSIGGFNFGNTPGNLGDFLNYGGETQWNYNQYLNAYLCSMNLDTCPERSFAHSVDEAALPCCNSTFTSPGPTPGGYFNNSCDNPYTDTPTEGSVPGGQANCGGIAAEQVRTAVNYLTAACNAQDSGESYCLDCASNYFMGSGEAGQTGEIRDTDGNQPGDPTYTHGWQCPGWSFDHIRPSISMTTRIQLAKCSLECQTDPFIRWQVDHNNNDCTDKGDTSCWAFVEEVTSERAIVELGAGCEVYEVVPEPILEIGIQLVLTSPSGTQVSSFLSNSGVAASIATVELDGVNFTHRMNQAYERGGAGPQIPGLIVICNHELPGLHDPEEYCCKDEDMGGSPSGSCAVSGSYNPYDPTPEDYPGIVLAEDADISVPNPTIEPYCTDGGRIGGIRSAFPHGYLPDGASIGIEVPQMNPWPQLVRKMLQSRSINGNAMPDEKDAFGINNEAFACHVPSERYLGVLNCGFPVYWYYVPPERKTSYGTDCGKIGINNNYVQQGGSDRMLCMQGDSSCTPAYGEPRFASDGAPFFRTPCQELGDMIKTSMNVTNLAGEAVTCSQHAVIPNALDMPGFQYLTLDSDDSTFYPNTWVHGDAGSIFLYQQSPLAQQQNILIDISTYTDSYYGGNVQTFTDGILTLGPGNSTVCFATANEQPGILVVGVVNTNQAHGGQYLVSLECENVQNGNSLTGDPTPSEQFTPAGGSDILVDVAAGNTVYVSWEVLASGTVPNGTDTDPVSNLSTAIGVPKCKVTLQHGGGDFAKLYELTVSCVAIAAAILAPSRNSELDETIIQVASCKEYQFFCWLSRHGPIEEGEILVISIFVGIFGIVLCGLNCKLLEADAGARSSKKALIKQYKSLETDREERQAAMTAKAIQNRAARAGKSPATT